MTQTGACIGWVVLLTGATASAQTYAPSQPQPPPGYAPGVPAQPPPLQSGGLTAPGPTPRSDQELRTEQRLNEAEREDSGRGLEFVWIEPEFGFAGFDLQALKDGDLLDGTLLSDKASGLSYGAGLGVRLVTLTAGVRFRWATLDPWDLWSVGGEVGLRIPFGRLEPYAQAGVGYAALTGFSGSAVDALGLTPKVRGVNFRVGGGADWYLTPVLSVGAKLALEALVSSRGASPTAAPTSIYGSDGRGIGLGYLGTVVVGLHF